MYNEADEFGDKTKTPATRILEFPVVKIKQVCLIN